MLILPPPLLAIPVLWLILLSLSARIVYHFKKPHDPQLDLSSSASLDSKPHRDVLMQMPDAKLTPQNKTHQILTLYLLAPAGSTYSGYPLVQALSSVNLHLGDMAIFHYPLNTHPELNPNGAPSFLWHVASVINPGTFDFNNLGQFSSPGLVFFIELGALPTHHLQLALTTLLETAHTLQEDLGGALYDEHHNPLTNDKIQQWFNDLSALESGQLTGDLFVNQIE